MFLGQIYIEAPETKPLPFQMWEASITRWGQGDSMEWWGRGLAVGNAELVTGIVSQVLFSILVINIQQVRSYDSGLYPSCSVAIPKT